MVYLDAAATAPILPEVRRAIAPYLNRYFHNPHVPYHQESRNISKIIRETEELLKSHINGHNGEIVWTSSGSMANYFATTGICIAMPNEHKSVNAYSYIDSYKYLNSIKNKNCKVAQLLVNNETGKIYEPSCLKQLGFDRLHVDAVQALGKMKIDVQQLQCDSLALSGHKIGALKGIGALWIKDESQKINIPYLGTPNVPGIVSFNAALKSINIDEDANWLSILEKMFWEQLNRLLGQNPNIFLNQYFTDKIPGILSIWVKNVNAGELIFALDDEDIQISNGAACGKSNVLKNLGLTEKQQDETIRVSFHKHLPMHDIATAAMITAENIKEIRSEIRS